MGKSIVMKIEKGTNQCHKMYLIVKINLQHLYLMPEFASRRTMLFDINNQIISKAPSWDQITPSLSQRYHCLL